MNDCPCQECLTKPICRNKPYHTLMIQCSIVQSYSYYNSVNIDDIKNKHRRAVMKLVLALDTKTWCITGCRHSGGFRIASIDKPERATKLDFKIIREEEYPPITYIREIHRHYEKTSL